MTCKSQDFIPKDLNLKTYYNSHLSLKIAQYISKKLLMDRIEFRQYKETSQFQQI
jgi:hypothetical protein